MSTVATSTPEQLSEKLHLLLSSKRIVRNTGENKVLDVKGRDRQPGTAVILWDKNGQDNQNWNFVQQGKNSYLIQSAMNNMVATIREAKRDDGTPIIMAENQNIESQRWRIEPQPDGAVAIISELRGCKGEELLLTGVGELAEVRRRLGDASQSWALED